jgi:hypothetical protein
MQDQCMRTTSLSDQVKIATLLFLALFYTEAPGGTSALNGNKLTTRDNVWHGNTAK